MAARSMRTEGWGQEGPVCPVRVTTGKLSPFHSLLLEEARLGRDTHHPRF